MHTSNESLFATTQDAARQLGQAFLRPDSDWQPVLFAVGPDGIAISALFGNADTPEVTSLIAGFLHHISATEAAVVQSTWALRPQHITPEALKSSVSQHPERVEALIVVHVDRSRAQMATAQIHRDTTSAPTLADFTTTHVPPVGPAKRIADAIRVGIQ
jgi:hypothetical protein